MGKPNVKEQLNAYSEQVGSRPLGDFMFRSRPAGQPAPAQSMPVMAGGRPGSPVRPGSPIPEIGNATERPFSPTAFERQKDFLPT